MQAVADEKRHDDHVRSLGGLGTPGHARILLHEAGLHIGIKSLAAQQLDLALDGLTRVFVVAGSVSRNEKSGLVWRRWGGFVSDHLAGPGAQHRRHAVVSSHRPTIKEPLAAALRRHRERSQALLARCQQSQFTRNDFLGEIAFTDEERNEKHPGGKNPATNLPEIRLLLPESLLDLRKTSATPKFISMLPSWRGGIGIERRPVANQDQGRIGK